MAKLKKTLPKNFRELIANQDWDTLKAELLKCETDAYEKGGISHIIFATGNNGAYLSADMIRWLVKERSCWVETSNIDKPYRIYQKPLDYYTALEQKEIVQTLLELGADPNNSHQPLLIAVKRQNLEIAELLLKYGANPNIYETVTNYTCLHEAMLANDVSMLKLLLSYEANPELEINGTVNSVLEDLLYYKVGCLDIQPRDLSYRIKQSLEPYILNHENDIFEMIKLLIEFGADIHRPNTLGILKKLHEQFYQCYVNHYFSSPEVEEKMEQFELKLYELMQFEPQ